MCVWEGRGACGPSAAGGLPRAARHWHRSRVPPGAPALLRGPCRARVTCSRGWLAGLAVLDCRAGQGPHCLSRPACVGRAHRRLDEGNPSLFVGNQGLDSRISSGLCTPPSRSPPLALRCCNAAQSELWTATSGWSASGRSPVKGHSRQSLSLDVHAHVHVDVGRASVAFRWAGSRCERPPHAPATDSQDRTKSQLRGKTGPDQTRPDRPQDRHAPVARRSCKRGVARPTLPSSSSSSTIVDT